jgi:molybdopterin molybdotransferase
MHVLGLPGNPVSAVVGAILVLIPLIRRLAGDRDVEPQIESAVLGCDLPENDERADYLRAPLTAGPDGPVAIPFPQQDSSMLAPLAKAGCLLVREPFEPPQRAGGRCRIIRLGL